MKTKKRQKTMLGVPFTKKCRAKFMDLTCAQMNDRRLKKLVEDLNEEAMTQQATDNTASSDHVQFMLYGGLLFYSQAHGLPVALPRIIAGMLLRLLKEKQNLESDVAELNEAM